MLLEGLELLCRKLALEKGLDRRSVQMLSVASSCHALLTCAVSLEALRSARSRLAVPDVLVRTDRRSGLPRALRRRDTRGFKCPRHDWTVRKRSFSSALARCK